MSAADSVLFIDYATTVKLLPVPDAMAICRRRLSHARAQFGEIVGATEPEARRRAPFHNHWHVKTVILEDEPIAGVRVYSYYDDGLRNTVGRLELRPLDRAGRSQDRTADCHSRRALDLRHPQRGGRDGRAQVAAAETPRTFGLIGVGTIGENCLRCLRHLYRFEEII